MQDVVVDEKIVAKVGELVLHVTEEPAYVGGKVDNVRWFVLVENSLCLGHVSADLHGNIDVSRAYSTG